jgi:hypothetical protein
LKYQERITTPSNELLNIAMRYKLPDGDESNLIELPVTLTEIQPKSLITYTQIFWVLWKMRLLTSLGAIAGMTIIFI